MVSAVIPSGCSNYLGHCLALVCWDWIVALMERPNLWVLPKSSASIRLPMTSSRCWIICKCGKPSSVEHLWAPVSRSIVRYVTQEGFLGWCYCVLPGLMHHCRRTLQFLDSSPHFCLSTVRKKEPGFLSNRLLTHPFLTNRLTRQTRCWNYSRIHG